MAMRSHFCVIVLLLSLSLLGGCAGERAAIMRCFAPKEETAEEAQRRYEQGKAEYDRKLSAYEADERMNASWRQGYGFNNPNPERIRRGQQPVDFRSAGRRPVEPRPPATISGLDL
jgi:hypothetical protein